MGERGGLRIEELPLWGRQRDLVTQDSDRTTDRVSSSSHVYLTNLVVDVPLNIVIRGRDL